MRVLHVVAYMSSDGAYGGPTSVALNQARALARQGHTVTVMAGAPIRTASIHDSDGVQIRLYPARFLGKKGKFALLISWKLILSAALFRCDVTHLHLARDFTVLPAALLTRWRKVPYVVQPHGMISPSRKRLASVLDRLVTKRILRSSGVALCLTPQEEDDLKVIQPQTLTRRIVNGVDVKPIPTYVGRSKRVVFLSRLHERKRPVAFVEMSARLQSAWPDVDFVLYGPDEGEGPAVRDACTAASVDGHIRWDGPVKPKDVQSLLADSLAFVLPSYGEVFPMAMLEAFQAGTPVIATDSLGIAAPCLRWNAALITDGAVTSLSSAVDAVLRSPQTAEDLRQGARAYLENDLSIDDVASQLEVSYRHASNARAKAFVEVSTTDAEQGPA